MNFVEAMRNETTWTTTENGAVAKNTTGNACLDLFGVIGSLRDTSKSMRIRRISLFEEAYKEDALLATKILFYARDIREGLGERQTFRDILTYLADNHPEALVNNMELIPFYGRFDDLYSFVGTPMEDRMFELMKKQFELDLQNMNSGNPVSLLAKWIKTPDTSSKKSRELGILTAKKLGYSVYDFKRILRKLRKHIDVTEVKMTANEWDQITYSAVPSRAMTLYRKAFGRHDTDRFGEFINKAVKGEEKINSSTLYPYDLVEKYMGYHRHETYDSVVEAQWKQLPNYVEPGTNAIVVADTSGSMMGRPICSAIGLAIYFAERNTGAYHNLFMSFSNQSNVHCLKGSSLYEKVFNLNRANWDMNTNLKAAFENVLQIALDNNVPAEEMVKSIIVISDMEIDYCGDRKWTFYDQMRALYASHGYEIPNIIFWNVASRHDVFHADASRKGVQLVSGQSATTFKQLVGAIGMTPVEMMHKVIDSDRYSVITIGEGLG